MPASGFGRPDLASAAQVSGQKGGKLPSQRVREELAGIEEEEGDEEIDWLRGVIVGKKRGRESDGGIEGNGKKRRKELTPSQKVRRRLEGLGPREAWDPDSP